MTRRWRFVGEPRIPILSGPASADRDATGTRVERVLAVGRSFLAIVGLVTIYLDPNEPTRLPAVTYGILCAYALYSVAILVYAHRAPRIERSQGMAVHGIDILWAAVLTFVSDGPGSPFFLFFLFSVLAAAHRWGLLGTLATTAITIGVYLLQIMIAAAGPWSDTWFASFDLQLSRTVLRVMYLVLTGFLLGYLAEQDKRSRAELTMTAHASRQPRVDLGLGGSVAAVSRTLLTAFRATSAVFVLRDRESRETHLWRIVQGPSKGGHHDANFGTTAIPRVDLDPAEQAAWLFEDPGTVWEGSPDGQSDLLRARVVLPGTWPLKRTRVSLPQLVRSEVLTERLLVANLGWSDAWEGRLYLRGVSLGPDAEEALHFLDALVTHVTPALTNVFLTNRLRARASAAERARVARELHDGSIQSLFGVEMKIQALRRSKGLPRTVATELEQVQDLVRGEVLSLRDLMQALRPIELDASDRLPDVLGALVERFRRDTGVPARFVFSGSISVAPPLALELVRIVQEALVNVRKHSRARNVLVRLTGTDAGCNLVVEDDGVGLPFEGRLAGQDLDRSRLGPAIIRERARLAGAQLSIDSTPGAGTRIELSVGVAV